MSIHAKFQSTKTLYDLLLDLYAEDQRFKEEEMRTFTIKNVTMGKDNDTDIYSNIRRS